MSKKDEDIARSARIAFERWRQAFKYNIDQYHEMHSFILGRQWDEDEEDMLKTFKKVPLQSNKLATMANALLGEQQQNTPQLQVVPMENCDEETAQVRELIVKDIMFSNNATTVYQIAAAQAFIGGFGCFYIGTEYSHNKSFDQDISYYSLKDASRGYWDIGAETVNKTDGNYAGFVSRMTRQTFREIFGKDVEEDILTESSITQSTEEIALATNPQPDDTEFNWADNEGISVMDHFVRKFEKDTLYKLSHGKVVNQEELDELIVKSKKINKEIKRQDALTEEVAQQNELQQLLAGAQQGQDIGSQPTQEQQVPQPEIEQEEGISDNRLTLWDNGEPVRIEDKREIKRSKIIHYKIAGNYVLDETEFPSEQLPVVFVDLNSYYDKDGKQVCHPFFIDAKDTQRYINYLRTQSAYILKISRYDQFIGSKKNVQGLDTQRNWKDPNAVQGLLAYDESPSGAKPEQLRPPELSQSLFTQYQLAIEDLYTSTGLYPTRMGQEGNEVSGKAIDARTRQGSYSTYVAFNSINRAIATGGEIVNEMIPRVYDSERVIALMSPDEGMKNVTINKQADEYGERIENDIRKGTYQVRLKPGPSFEGQKQESLQSLQQVLQINPQVFGLVADLYAENLPLANTIELKNRLKTLVPPQIIEAGKTGKMPKDMGNNQPSPEEQQQQLQQQMAQMEMQSRAKEIQIKEQELQLKAQQQQIDLQIEAQKLEAEKLEIAGKIEEQKLRYLAETQRTQSDASISHADNLVKILTHKIPTNDHRLR